MQILNFLQNLFPVLNDINFLNYSIRITLSLYLFSFILFILLSIKYILSSFFILKNTESKISLFIKKIKFYSLFLFLFLFSLPIYFIITINILKKDQYFVNNIKQKPDIIKYTKNFINFDKNNFFFYEIKRLEKKNFTNKDLLNNNYIYIKIKHILLEKNTKLNNISGNLKNIVIKNEYIDKPDLFHFFMTYNNKVPFKMKINKMQLEILNKNLILIKNFDGIITSKYIKDIKIKGNFIINKKLNELSIINIKIEKSELTKSEIDVLYQLYKNYYKNFKEDTNTNILMIDVKKELSLIEFIAYLNEVLKTKNFKNINIELRNINIKY